MPVIRRLLVEDAEADRMIVAVTDAGGRMLWVEGDAGLRSRAAGMHFVEGARWAEDVAGTNAPGTALAVDHAVQIYGSEHYRRPVQPWSCSAAPVHDPVTGVAARRHRRDRRRPRGQPARAHPRAGHGRGGRVGAALAAPRAAAARRRPPPAAAAAAGPAARGPGPGAGAADACPAGPVELSLRHSELLLLLAEAAVAGEGRTAAQLAAECHPGDAAAVTVRAELSRLRRLVGADLVGSRPYRLLGRIDTDLDQVRRLLARGAVGSALERYPGAVLPGSRAPGVAVARERVARAAPPGRAAQPPSRAAAALRPAARGPGRRRRLADLPRVAAAELAAPGGGRRAPAAAAARATPALTAARECPAPARSWQLE